MGRSWSSVYGKLVLGVWKELRLTGRGGRRGETGYSNSREQGCVVTIKQAGSEAAYFASSGLHQAESKKAKEDDFWPALRRMGKLNKTRKGRLWRDCEEGDNGDRPQGVLHP